MEGSNTSNPDRKSARHEERVAGNPSYAGYEYQIEVTIWIALQLIIAESVTDKVDIEPQSYEDIEVSIQNPDNAHLGIGVQIPERIDLIFQIKTRSNSPWTSSEMSKILRGSAKGQRRRPCPLELLQKNPNGRYIFVTNEALAESLRIHQGNNILEFPAVSKLPPYVRNNYDPETQANLAPRLLLCGGLTQEVLKSRIERLLSDHGHIPIINHVDCLRDLRESIRKRICGYQDGIWTQAELLNVLKSHGGSVSPTRTMDHFIPPCSFDKIQETLDKSHAVVIAGPSGTGKSLTGDILEYRMRNSDPPFIVVGEKSGPSKVRELMMHSVPILFHLRDPWGENRLSPESERWSGELQKLLCNAGPEKKFLITSRSDILQSAGSELTRFLAPYTVQIRIEDYGTDRLNKIYDNLASDLTGHARALAQSYRKTALKSLQRPYEIDRFIVALQREIKTEPRSAEQIVSDSQIDAISGVIADQIKHMGSEGVVSSTVIWALLIARGSAIQDIIADLLRQMRSIDSSVRIDIDTLIDFMIVGRNLRQEGARISFYHPKVEEGLQRAFMRNKSEAEHVLSLVIDGLSMMGEDNDDWGIETGLAVYKAVAKLEKIQILLRPRTKGRLDDHLEKNALQATRQSDFEQALKDLARFGSNDHLCSRLARILIKGSRESKKFSIEWHWSCPKISEPEIIQLRKDFRTKPLVESFIREVLPFSPTYYDLALVDLLIRISPDVEDSFWDALDTVKGPGGPNCNIEVIVAGACASDSPDYDRVIAMFAQSNTEAKFWLKNEFAEESRQAEEHEVDAIEADHIHDESSDRFYNAQAGMKHIVKIRSASEGFDWILEHPEKQLLVSAATELMGDYSCTPRFKDLRLILENAEGWTREKVWEICYRYWSVGYLDLLKAELVKENLGSTIRGKLVKLAAKCDANADDPIPLITEISRHASLRRKFELIYDLNCQSLENDGLGELSLAARRTRAERLCETFDVPAKELGLILIKTLNGEEILSLSRNVPESVVNLLESLLLDVSCDVAGPLACIAVGVGVDISVVVKRLLSDGSASDGIAAVQALRMTGGKTAYALLLEALENRRFQVRRAALESLFHLENKQIRSQLIAMAYDRSADIRLAWSQLIQQHKWPEAIPELVRLLSDQRDFSSNHAFLKGSSWSEFRVARAAAQTLGSYEDLPESAITALIETVRNDSRDPFVTCAAISALALRDDERITCVIKTELINAHMKGLAESKVIAHAAVWSLFDRAIGNRDVQFNSKMISLAVEGDPVIAGPLLIISGLLGGETRRTLANELCNSGQESRENLLKLSEVVAESERSLKSGWIMTISKLASGTDWDRLGKNEQIAFQSWVSNLNVENDVDNFTLWVINSLLDLPFLKDVDDPRLLKALPQVEVLTMRSFSAAREEESREK